MTISHAYVSTKSDPADTTKVGKTKWNANHVVDIHNADVSADAGVVESKLALNYSTHTDLVAVVSKSSAYGLGADDELCLVTGTTTITLPTAVGRTGKVYAVKRIGTGTVTIATTSSQTIDGDASFSLTVQYDCLAVVSDGANWIVV